jgi:hypothetical protein
LVQVVEKSLRSEASPARTNADLVHRHPGLRSIDNHPKAAASRFGSLGRARRLPHGA